MTKIPVFATVGEAYRFAFRNYARILGVCWVTMVLIVAEMLWQFAPFLEQMQAATASKNPQMILSSAGHLFLFDVICLVLFVVLNVGVARVALDKPVRWPFFYLAIGSDFWRLIFGYFLLFLILFVGLLVVTISLGIVFGVLATHAAGPNADPAQIQRVTMQFQPLIVLPIYAVMFFIWIRFGFLLAAIAISERRIGIGRNWALTRGNFWRLLGITLLIFVPIIVLTLVNLGLLMLFGGLNFSAMGSPVWAAHMMGFYVKYWYAYIAVWLVFAPIFYGPLIGVSAICYRALTGTESVPA